MSEAPPSPMPGEPSAAAEKAQPPPEADPPEADAPASPGGELPDAPIFALLGGLANLLGIDGIDSVWLFPPRRIPDGETAVVVVSAFHDEDRRRVLAAHYTARTETRETAVQERIAEYGIAPTQRVGRVVEGVLNRVEDELSAAPRHIPVRGEEDRWSELLESLRDDPTWSREAAQRAAAPPIF